MPVAIPDDECAAIRKRAQKNIENNIDPFAAEFRDILIKDPLCRADVMGARIAAYMREINCALDEWMCERPDILELDESQIVSV